MPTKRKQVQEGQCSPLFSQQNKKTSRRLDEREELRVMNLATNVKHFRHLNVQNVCIHVVFLLAVAFFADLKYVLSITYIDETL